MSETNEENEKNEENEATEKHEEIEETEANHKTEVSGQSREKERDLSGWAKPLPEKLPGPTVWPVTVALGVTLLSFGIVSHWIMSIAGLGLFLLGAGGWFGDLRNDVLQ